MKLPGGTWAIALGAFGACVLAAGLVAGWPDAGDAMAAAGMPLIAVLSALPVARWARLDRAIARALFCSIRDPQTVIEGVVACAEAARRVGPAGLPHLASDQKDPLLADGLRLIAIGAGPDVLRDALERRMEAGAARAFLRLRVGTWVRAVGPMVTLPLMALCAAWMLPVGSVASPSVGTTSAAIGLLVLFPLVAFGGPARQGPSVADGVLHATLVIEGLIAMRAGQSPSAIREHLSRLLPAAAFAQRAAMAA